jgi:hypothetical protein
MLVIYGGITMQERRIHTEDRRRNLSMPKVPFRDSSGDIVALNRRYIPDRRISHLTLKYSMIEH